jgi:hypothetical protein
VSFAPIDRLTVGADLGDQWSHYCILGLEGQTLAEGQLRTTQQHIAEFFQAFRDLARRGMWAEAKGGASVGLSISRPIVRDTQTIHRASNPLCSLRLFAGRYGATGALQLLRDPTGRRPFTAQTRVQVPPGTPNQ